MPMKSVINIIEDFKLKLNATYGEKEVMQFIYILFEEYLNWAKTQINYAYTAILTEEQSNLFQSALEALEKDKPIQYIIGKTWFNGNEYILNAAVLIPRPETEELCILIKNDNIHQQFHEFSILDIGTGSGIIAIDLQLQFPYSKVKAIDLSEESLSVARINANKHNCDIDFQQMNILDPFVTSSQEKYDLIVSNPPYVLESERHLMCRNVTAYEPQLALYVPDEDPLLFYKAITEYAMKHLIRPGNLYFEINEKFGKEVKSLLHVQGFSRVEIVKDIQGKDRFIKAELKPSLHDNSYWYADK